MLLTGQLFQLQLDWVKSHSSMQGNIVADKYARETPFLVSNNSHVVSSRTTAKTKITAFFQNKWAEEWRCSIKELIRKAFFKSPKAASILKPVHFTQGLNTDNTAACCLQLTLYCHFSSLRVSRGSGNC